MATTTDERLYDQCIDALLKGEIDEAGRRVEAMGEGSIKLYARLSCAAVRAAIDACLGTDLAAMTRASAGLEEVLVESVQRRWRTQLKEAAQFRGAPTRAEAEKRLAALLPCLREKLRDVLDSFPMESASAHPESASSMATDTLKKGGAPKPLPRAPRTRRHTHRKPRAEERPVAPSPMPVSTNIQTDHQFSPAVTVDDAKPSLSGPVLLGTPMEAPPHPPTVLGALEWNYMTFASEETLRKFVPADSSLTAEIERADRELRSRGRRVLHKKGLGWSVVPIDFREPKS